MSISYPIARDADGNWVSIGDAQKKGDYYCPECDSPFIVRLGEIRTHHFAHRPGYTGICTGESGYHNLAKHLLAYHFGKQGFILLLAKCPICERVFETKKMVTRTDVERGDANYRPDVRLHLDDDTVVDCEVVFKNPPGEKLKAYRSRGANLIIWEIPGQVDKVPPSIQYYWDESAEYLTLFESHRFRDRLLILASPTPPKHTCSSYCIAYLFELDCSKCNSRTKVALVSSWFPKWISEDELGVSSIGNGEQEYRFYTYLRGSIVPHDMLTKLNKVHGVSIGEDHSKTAGERYLMNHCGSCGAKIGDYFLPQEMMQLLSSGKGHTVQKVNIGFELTRWEQVALKKNSYTGSNQGVVRD